MPTTHASAETVKIYIDPGHGGTDTGAVGNGLREKDLTLDIALRIRNILNAEYTGHEIRMSRTSDVYPTLTQRTTDANNWERISSYLYILIVVVARVMKIIVIQMQERQLRLIKI